MSQPEKTKHVSFIINPHAGSGKGLKLRSTLAQQLDGLGFLYDLHFTEGKGHATSIAKNLSSTDTDLIVACGGDGTVNEIAHALVGKVKPMTILPMGSGNGLARHYGLKNDIRQLQTILQSNKIIQHDAVNINGSIGFNVSGIGFDAHVASLFGNDGKRGFNSYLKLIVKEFSNYKSFATEITAGHVTKQISALMIPISVASQFGNNAFIAPFADTMDGMTDVTVVHDMPGTQVLPFAIRVFTKTISGSKRATQFRERDFIIKCDRPQPLHIDGEPVGFFEHFRIETIPAALRLAIP